MRMHTSVSSRFVPSVETGIAFGPRWLPLSVRTLVCVGWCVHRRGLTTIRKQVCKGNASH